MKSMRFVSMLRKAVHTGSIYILIGALCVHPAFGFTATAGSGTVVVGGFLQDFTDPNTGWHTCDFGSLSITVNGTGVADIPYSSGGGGGEGPCDGIDPSFYAQYLKNAINLNGSSPVSATWDGGDTITLTAKTTGSGTNYSLSVSTTFDQQDYHTDSNNNSVPDFTQASYTLTPSGSTLTGGHN